jgi:hypothetical protein
MQAQFAEVSQDFVCGWYMIQVFAPPLRDGTFEAHGWIRHAIKNPTVHQDLPYEYPFNMPGEVIKTTDEAISAGVKLAEKTVCALK